MAAPQAVLYSLIAIVWLPLQWGLPQQHELYFVRPDGYKAQDIPVTTEGSPTFSVEVDLVVWSITEVSLQKQHMEIDLNLVVMWTDHRLTLTPNVSSTREWVSIGKEIDSVWSPTLTFFNCVGCSPVHFKSNSGVPVYVGLEEAALWAEVRKLLRFRCNIELQFYPMDVQRCYIQIYAVDDYVQAIILKHFNAEGDRKMKINVSLSEFAPPSIHTGHCNISMYEGEDVANNTHSCLELRVRFERLLGYHMTTSYLPTSVIVVLSWISFWLPADVIPARVALGLTSLLTLATRLDQAQKDLPPVSYAKAIDVWMLACILLVSLSLLEFAVCNYLLRRGKESEGRKKTTCLGKQRHPQITTIRQVSDQPVKVLPSQHKDADAPGKQQDGMMLDRISRIVFPAIFILFNFIYWSYYLHSSPTRVSA